MDCVDPGGHETPIAAARWRWQTLPLAGLAFCGQVTDAFTTLFGNLSFTVGAHLKFLREQEDEPAGGPIIRTE